MARRYKHLPVDMLLWSAVDTILEAESCWVWPKATNACGYGLFRLTLSDGSVETLAHRVAWILTYGSIPPGKRILHTCDNPPCIRPSHLWLGTQAENVQDMNTKGRTVYGTRSIDKQGRWSLKHAACIICHTTTRPYQSNGRCTTCYWRWYNAKRN